MTGLLDSKIQSLMVQVVEASPPADEIEEIMELRLGTEPVRPATPPRPGLALRPRRGWVVALGATAAVLAVVGGFAWLFSSIGSSPPVATTPQVDSLSSLTWSRVPHDDAVFGGQGGQSMFDVTVGGPGLVAVGESGTPGDFDAAVWTSADGVTWSRVPHNDAVFGGDAYQGMTSVIVGGPGLVAVGSEGPHYDRSAAVWTSADGVTWSRVPQNEAVFGKGSMGSVTVGGPGLVAVGSDGDPQTRIHNAVVWTSPDGITWSRVPHNEAIFSGEIGVSMGSVTPGGPGLVARGTQWSPEDSSEVVWTSPDGITWSRVSRDDEIFASEEPLGPEGMTDVIAVGAGLVAVGFVGDPQAELNDAAVWTSPDGITWSRVPHNETVFGGQPQVAMLRVIVGGPGLVAVGESGLERDFDAAVWIARVED